MRCAALLVVGGCSFVFTNAPEPRTGELPDCTTSRAPVIGDVLGALPTLVAGGVFVGAAIAGHGPGDSGPATGYKLGIPFLTAGVAFFAAAIYGAHNVSACDEALDDALERVSAAASAGKCDVVIAFARRVAERDRALALALISEPALAKCFSL